ncbi:hypothetical protein GOBAR_DD26276 [Gossypium barbadense]|nr:hypothetical protein GOBAR_DD26276 [Gossypium barbadense]
MKLFTLNLSHNSLTGPVPRAFSNLKDMESLDLSYNNLTGNIPAEFAVLHFLEYFNVSYNNLSGKTPERIGQLGAFDESNYVGNPFLRGSLVGKNCSPVTTPLTRKASSGIKEDHGFIDVDAFYASFFACYMMIISPEIFVLETCSKAMAISDKRVYKGISFTSFEVLLIQRTISGRHVILESVTDDNRGTKFLFDLKAEKVS